jgi:AraC family transcriptional regulator of adaptative response/methylated-DNA-[protein]-cysteine methyltransferase
MSSNKLAQCGGCDSQSHIRGTQFQKLVWQHVRQVPVGRRITYRELAVTVGQPRSVRAVAQACATSGVAVVIPCHRVVCEDRSLSGYRWGRDRKSWLLERENRVRANCHVIDQPRSVAD